MPPPKKAAKKAATKHSSHDDRAKDLRRAYEHLGRVEILHASLRKDDAKIVTALTKLAQQELAAEHMKDAADLLRASEHLSFGYLQNTEAESILDPALLQAIKKEFHHKLEKADEHWSQGEEHHPAVSEFYGSTSALAQKAFEAEAWRRALEFARGADALAHVKVHAPKKLPGGADKLKLKA